MLATCIYLIPVDGFFRIFFSKVYISIIIDILFITSFIAASSKLKIRNKSAFIPLITLCCISIVFSTIIHDFKSTYIHITSFRLTGLYFFALLIPFMVTFKDSDLRKLYRSIIIIAIVCALNAIRQWLLPLPQEIFHAFQAGGATRFFGDSYQGSQTSFRPFSFFITSVHLVFFLSFALFVSAAAYFKNYSKGTPEKLCIILSLIGILITFSRTGWISFIAGLLFTTPIIFNSRNKARNYIITAFAAGILIAISASSELLSSRLSTLSDINSVSSFNSRIAIWEERVEHITSTPMGSGVGSAGWNANDEMGLGADSNYLKFYIELGWIGGSIFMLLLISIIYKHFRLYPYLYNSKQFSVNDVFLCGAIGIFSTTLISMITNQVLEAFPMNLIFWFFIGVSIAPWKNSHS